MMKKKKIVQFWITMLSLTFTQLNESAVQNLAANRVLELYQMMKVVHEVFGKYGIEYWVQGGTILGALRHKGMIPWDDDLDVNIDVTQENAFLALIPVFKQNGYSITNPYPNQHWIYKIRPLKPGGMVLDIFLTVRKPDKVVYKYHWFKRDGQPIYVTKDELYPLKLYPFGEIQIYGPKNPEPYLDASFTKEWRTMAHKWNHMTNEKEKMPITDADRIPAQPTGPLNNNIKF